MNQSTVNPNLTSPVLVPTFSYKDILVKKIIYSVVASVASQILILILYIILANTSIYPREWISSILSTVFHLSTWVFVTIFSLIIFAECLICSKDYVYMRTYCSTRFQYFWHVYSFHNFLLLSLHVVTGGAFVWQCLSIIDSSHRSLLIHCKNRTLCLVEDTFFLILGGLWTGFYYFTKIYVPSKNLVFPVIQQRKFLQFRLGLYPMFRKSVVSSFWPTLYFALFYYFFGKYVENYFVGVFGVGQSLRESSFLVYFFLWWFSIWYFFSMNLMRFFFHLFLTEPITFPLVKESDFVLTLQDAIVIDKLPIIQHLACLDLFLLSQWSALRRQLLFSLSQPGAHPHNWNSLIENVLKLFNDYTDLIKRSIDGAPLRKTIIIQNDPSDTTCPTFKYRHFRNMTIQNDDLDTINVSSNLNEPPSFEFVRVFLKETLDKIIHVLKIYLGINFLFGELSQVNVQKCLGNGQLIIWASHGITELATASLTEDQYGIVQKDLVPIVTSLVHLKQNLDKLVKILPLSKKGGILGEADYKMKNAISAAIKHNLFSICLNFGQYFNDMPLNKDVKQYLQTNVMLNT